MSSILAFSVQHEVEKYGAYIAIASFLGLALLSILYFAQAREVRRLRDWAGRAPERDAELEARVTMQAEEARRGQVARPGQPARAATAASASQDTQVTAPPAAAPAGNGHVGAPLTVPMGPRPATAAALVAAAVEAAATGEEEQPSGVVATAPTPDAPGAP